MTLPYSKRIILGITALLMLFQITSALAIEPSENRECATCHIMWLNEFRREDLTTLIPFDPKPREEYGKSDVASAEKMCFSCHDGFMLDSRQLWREGQYNGHPVGQKPSENTHIPTIEGKKIFPMNEDGKVYCGTCHSAHGVEWDKETESAIFLRIANVGSGLCMACHLERSTGTKEGNHPVSKKLQADTPPPSLLNAGAKFSTNMVICESCHSVHTPEDDHLLVVHNDRSQLCGACHTDKYPEDEFDPARTRTHPVNVKSDDVTIPDNLIEKGALTGPDLTVICQTCHRPHYAIPELSLLIAENSQSSLCKSCHKKQQSVITSKHNMVLVDPELKNIKDQTVAEGGECSACHLPHGGTGPKMWARTVAEDQDVMSAECLGCHQDEGIAHDFQIGEFSHPVGLPFSRLARLPDLPGYSKDGFRVQGEEGLVTCASCHDPHQWDPSDPEKASKPGDQGDFSNRFLRTAGRSISSLCLSCHAEKESIDGSKHDLVAMDISEENIMGELPQDAGLCSSCHVPHNAIGPMMWARNLLSESDPISAACLSCHDEEGIGHNKVVGGNSHPVNVPIENLGLKVVNNEWTNTKNEIATLKPLYPLPLFNEDGHLVVDGGLVTCGTCHDPHQWSPTQFTTTMNAPSPTIEEEGDGSTSFLRIEYTETDDLCTNCHRSNATVALSQHNLPDETGICGSCHKPHNGEGAKMWARTVSAEYIGIEQLCRSCHRDEGVAHTKQIGEYSHPVQVTMVGGSDNPKIPLYGAADDGSTSEQVDCGSCHNSHQWDPIAPLSNAGLLADTEGDATNSFLRLSAIPDGQLCVGCHME